VLSCVSPGPRRSARCRSPCSFTRPGHRSRSLSSALHARRGPLHARRGPLHAPEEGTSRGKERDFTRGGDPFTRQDGALRVARRVPFARVPLQQARIKALAPSTAPPYRTSSCTCGRKPGAFWGAVPGADKGGLSVVRHARAGHPLRSCAPAQHDDPACSAAAQYDRGVVQRPFSDRSARPRRCSAAVQWTSGTCFAGVQGRFHDPLGAPRGPQTPARCAPQGSSLDYPCAPAAGPPARSGALRWSRRWRSIST
jgi:hypothetical protein